MPDADSGEHGLGENPTAVAERSGDEPRGPGEPERPSLRSGGDPEAPLKGRQSASGATPASSTQWTVRLAIREGMAVVGVGLWVAFWMNIAYLHLQHGALPEAVLTTTLFATPPVVAYVWHVGRTMGLVDPSMLPSLRR